MASAQNVFVSCKSSLSQGQAADTLVRPVGGVVSAVESARREVDGAWIAWDGGSVAVDSGQTPPSSESEKHKLIHLAEQEISGWYYGFANQVLWPLLHSLPEKCKFSAADWQTFSRVNWMFAQKVIQETRSDATIWIHDYQTALVPAFIRSRRPSAQICFFCHVPFPDPRVFQINPWWKKVIIGMLGADVICFHREGHVENFLEIARRCVPQIGKVDAHEIHSANRVTRVRAIPLGIDAELFDDLSRSPAVSREVQDIRTDVGSDYLVLGVDRIDYTKGLPERLRALELLLTTAPRLRGKISLLQVAIPCRSGLAEYRQLKGHVEEMARQINDKFAVHKWVPVRLITSPLARDRLVALYRAADLALVTPLRDGLNLVAKEYVASKAGDVGMLLLSKFAGVAEDFAPDAPIVNPHDSMAVAHSIVRTMRMPPPEKRERMRRLLEKVRSRNSKWWMSALGECLLESRRQGPPAKISHSA